MSNIAAVKKIIQVQEVAYAAAVSSAVGNRLGASINFLLQEADVDKSWAANGRYGNQMTADSSIDGPRHLIKNVQVVGFAMSNGTAGPSGITEIDIRRQVASGSAGASIFSTRPSISFSAGNNSKLSMRLDPNATYYNPTGTVLPVFATTLFNAGDTLYMDFVTRQSLGRDLTVTLILRPI